MGIERKKPVSVLISYSVYLFAFSIPVSIFIGQIAAGLVIFVGLAAMLSRQESENIPLMWLILIPSFLILVLFSSLFAADFGDTIPQLGKIWVLLCFFPLVAFRSSYSGKRAVDFLILGAATASILALFRYFSGAVDRAAPFSGGYTTLAIFIAAAIPLAVWNFAVMKSSKRWVYLGLSLLMGCALILTKTRAGWLAALIGLFIIGFALYKKRAFIGLLLGILLFAAIPQTRGIVLDRFDLEKKGGVTSGRVLIYKSAVEPLSDLPVYGYGPGSFAKLVSPGVLERIGDTGIKSWHSTPLEILMESGPLALIFFTIIAFLPVRESFRKKRDFPAQKLFQTAVLGSFAALYLAGLTTNLTRDFMLLSLLVFLWSIPYTFRETILDISEEAGVKING